VLLLLPEIPQHRGQQRAPALLLRPFGGVVRQASPQRLPQGLDALVALGYRLRGLHLSRHGPRNIASLRYRLQPLLLEPVAQGFGRKTVVAVIGSDTLA